MEVRITKYNPDLRDTTGAYLADDWTSVSDIGKYDGLTPEEYLRVENNYWDVLYSALVDIGDDQLSILDIESRDLDLVDPNPLVRSSAHFCKNFQPVEPIYFKNFQPVMPVSLEQFKPLFQAAMREVVGFRVENKNGTFIHFGYDFYLYMGSPKDFVWKNREGIWVENFVSPYHEGLVSPYDKE